MGKFARAKLNSWGELRAGFYSLQSSGNKKAIVRDRLAQEHLDDWNNSIKQLAQDFLDGNADVDPREYPKTCERCDLHALCRVQENRAESDDGDEEETDDE